MAADTGLDGFALTDHDTLDGWDEAAAACDHRELTFVPGIELSTEEHERSVHLLGYWVDPADSDLIAECARLRSERHRRAAAMVQRLAALGVGVSLDRVEQLAGAAPIGRPHVAAALVETGAVADLGEAFARYLADGGPAYEPKRACSPEHGVALITGAGGAAVLAHPGLRNREGVSSVQDGGLVLLDRLVAVGLAGVEADHPGHEPEVEQFWRDAAVDRGLVVTGASDFHGVDSERTIGQRTTGSAAVSDLAGRCRPRRQAAVPGKRGGRTW